MFLLQLLELIIFIELFKNLVFSTKIQLFQKILTPIRALYTLCINFIFNFTSNSLKHTGLIERVKMCFKTCPIEY